MMIRRVARGLTLGGWFWFNNAAAAQEVCIAKGNGAPAATGYWLARQATGHPWFIVSDGAAFQGPFTSEVVGANQWVFLVGRFFPSTEVAIFVNGNKYTDVVGIPAATVNSALRLTIGAYDNAGVGALLMTGRASLCFLCAAMLSDAMIDSVFQQTRAALGV